MCLYKELYHTFDGQYKKLLVMRVGDKAHGLTYGLTWAS